MNRLLSSRLAKACLFVLCLIPLALLGYRVYSNDLSANPIEFIEHYTGDWAIRLLLVTLCVTPLRKLTGWSLLSRFRRMVGLYAFFYAVLHFLTYLWFDQQFAPMAILDDIGKRRYRAGRSRDRLRSACWRSVPRPSPGLQDEFAASMKALAESAILVESVSWRFGCFTGVVLS